MSSLPNREEHLQEQPVKKRRIDNSEEKPENIKPSEVNLPMEGDKNKELHTSTIMGDLPRSSGRHRKLPAELNCQIFYCVNLPTRRKFICGLGWNFYAMFRQSLLIKSKRLCNVEGNGWSRSKGDVTISEDGLNAKGTQMEGSIFIYAEKGFAISVADCRTDGFPGTICYYYEVQSTSERFSTGFVHGGFVIGVGESNYVIATISTDGRRYEYTEVPVEARPEPPNVQGNLFGCGLLIDPDNKVAIFFTSNGFLLGKQIPISPSVDRLFPVVFSMLENGLTFEANFGNDKVKPFQYDIRNCPGMALDCI